jgi:hypothetical protein
VRPAVDKAVVIAYMAPATPHRPAKGPLRLPVAPENMRATGEYPMTTSIKDHDWVWVLIQDPGENEQIAGQLDTAANVAFIPVFMSKEDAWKCTHALALSKEHRYEPQAIVFEDLTQYAVQAQFQLFVLNGDGEIIEKKSP